MGRLWAGSPRPCCTVQEEPSCWGGFAERARGDGGAETGADIRGNRGKGEQEGELWGRLKHS